MRKWIVMAVVIAIVAGIGIAVLMSRQDSAEELERKYFAACFSTLMDHMREKWHRLTGQGQVPPQVVERHRRTRVEAHLRALVKAGYLNEQKFPVFGQRPEAVLRMVAENAVWPLTTRGFVPLNANYFVIHDFNKVVAAVRTEGTNLVVVAPRAEMHKWEAATGKFQATRSEP